MTLSSKQKEVVRWLIDNGREDAPYAAVHAGIVSGTAISKWGGAAVVTAWCEEFKHSLPPPPMTPAEISGEIQALIPDALRTIAETLQNGRGDRVSVELAKWVLKDALAPQQPVVKPDSPDEAELRNLISVSFGKA